MGNPALFPLFDHCDQSDIIIVQINPMERKGVPRTAREILNRINEITFNGSLMREFRAIDFVSRLIEEGRLDNSDYNAIRIHMVSAEEEIKPLSASSKLNAEWAFLRHLFEVGREHAELWLDANFDHLGRKSTVDLRSIFQD